MSIPWLPSSLDCGREEGCWHLRLVLIPLSHKDGGHSQPVFGQSEYKRQRRKLEPERGLAFTVNITSTMERSLLAGPTSHTRSSITHRFFESGKIIMIIEP